MNNKIENQVKVLANEIAHLKTRTIIDIFKLLASEINRKRKEYKIIKRIAIYLDVEMINDTGENNDTEQ